MHRKQIERTTINTVSIFRHPCSKHWLKGRLGRTEKLRQQLPSTIFIHVNFNAPWTANYLAFVKHNFELFTHDRLIDRRHKKRSNGLFNLRENLSIFCNNISIKPSYSIVNITVFYGATLFNFITKYR